MILNGNEEDLVIMKQRMELRQQKHKKNKEKKIKIVKVEAFEKSDTPIQVNRLRK